MNRKREIATALLGIVVAIILWITILSREAIIGTTVVYRPLHAFLSFWESVQRGGMTGNFLGNILLFVPVGSLLPLVTEADKLHWTVLPGFGFSLLIEITQFISARGFFDPDDVLLNTIGVAMGVALLRIARVIRKNL